MYYIKLNALFVCNKYYLMCLVLFTFLLLIFFNSNRSTSSVISILSPGITMFKLILSRSFLFSFITFFRFLKRQNHKQKHFEKVNTGRGQIWKGTFWKRTDFKRITLKNDSYKTKQTEKGQFRKGNIWKRTALERTILKKLQICFKYILITV